MDLTPLLNASWIVPFHVVAAFAALSLGGVQLLRRKGDAGHRTLGYTWVFLMLAIAISSFWIREINQWRGLSLIHLLSILTLITVPLGVYAVRRGSVSRHRSATKWIFWSALVTAGLFTFLPGRVLHQVLFG